MRIIFLVLGILFYTTVWANTFFQNLFSDQTSDQTVSTYNDETVTDAEMPLKRIPSKYNIFIFDPNKFVWGVYNKNGDRVGAGVGSGGKDFCPDINAPCRTVEGEYTVFRKEDHDCTSKTFPIDEGGGAPMPHCMFFYKGYAIHGSKNFGRKNLSHGCIRVSEKAAAWMNQNYIYPGSLVIVKPYH